MIAFIEFVFKEKLNLEQIAGVGKIIAHRVGHGWIYGYVQRYKLTGDKLYKKLCHGRSKYRKGSRARRVIIPNCVGVECLHVVVNKKKRFGDWEADTVLGKRGTGEIVSLVERHN